MEFLEIIFPITKAIRNPNFINILTILWIAGTILIASYFIFDYQRQYKRCLKNIIKLNEIISKFGTQNLTARFEELNQELTTLDPYLQNIWEEFYKSLLITKDNSGTEKIFACAEAGYFFNEISLFSSRINQKFYNALPGILTSLGILGTFVGLTIGIAQVKLNANDVNNLKEGIEGLLSGLNTSFSTSVWGISSSIVFSWFEKNKLNTIHQKINELCISINTLFACRTSELWIYSVLEENRQQTAELKKFNTDLAISIASALDEKLAYRLTPALDKLLFAIEELTRTGTSEIASKITAGAGNEINRLNEVLNQVGCTLEDTVSRSNEYQQRAAESFQEHLDRFTSTINGLLKESFEQQRSLNNTTQEAIQSLFSKIEADLGRQMEEMKSANAAAQDKVLEQMNVVFAELSGAVRELKEQTRETSGQIRQNTEVLFEQMHRQLEDITRQCQTEGAVLTELVRQLEGMLDQVKEMTAQAGKAAKHFGQSAVPVKEASTELLRNINLLMDSQKVVTETIKQSRDQWQKYANSVEQTLALIKQSLETTKQSWQAYESKFGLIRGSLEEVFNVLNSGLVDYTSLTRQGMREYLDMLDKSFKDALGHLAGAIEELSEAAETFSEKA